MEGCGSKKNGCTTKFRKRDCMYFPALRFMHYALWWQAGMAQAPVSVAHSRSRPTCKILGALSLLCMRLGRLLPCRGGAQEGARSPVGQPKTPRRSPPKHQCLNGFRQRRKHGATGMPPPP